jgi:hypothetical protein
MRPLRCYGTVSADMLWDDADLTVAVAALLGRSSGKPDESIKATTAAPDLNNITRGCSLVAMTLHLLFQMKHGKGRRFESDQPPAPARGSTHHFEPPLLDEAAYKNKQSWNQTSQ